MRKREQIRVDEWINVLHYTVTEKKSGNKGEVTINNIRSDVFQQLRLVRSLGATEVLHQTVHILFICLLEVQAISIISICCCPAV